MGPGVSIIIPTWNGLDLLKRFLPSALASATAYAERSGAPTEVVIVDDGSTDGTAGWLVSQGFKRQVTGDRLQVAGSSGPVPCNLSPVTCRLIGNEINLGFGETCNKGVAAASHPLVFLLNNDVEMSPDAIFPLVENFGDPSVFAAHCRVFDLESGKQCGAGKVGGFSRGFLRVHQSYVQSGGPDQEGSPGAAPLYSIFAGGGSAMFDRDKFLGMGGFDSLLSPFYWEDVELSYRAWKRGFSVLYEPRSITRHRVSSTIGKLGPRKVRMIEQRNRLIYHWVHLHDRRLLASHVFRVFLLALAAPLNLNQVFILSCVAALKALPGIRKRRREERGAATRTDREVLGIFRSLARRPDVRVYDN